MHLGKDNPHHQYSLGDVILKQTHIKTDLGVFITDDMKFHEHCKNVSQKCNQLIRQVKRSFVCKEAELMMNIYKSYLLPHVDYACVVWNPYQTRDINMIEAVQRRFTKIIHRLTDMSYEERLTVLELPTLAQRRCYFDVLQVWKLMNGYDVVESKMFEEVNKIQVTRSTSKPNLVEERARMDMKKYFFTVRGAKEWNSLPEPIHVEKNLNTF